MNVILVTKLSKAWNGVNWFRAKIFVRVDSIGERHPTRSVTSGCTQ